MGMTIAVYRLDPLTGERTTLRDRYEVHPASQPVPSSAALPPCGCDRCAARARAGGSRDATGTVRAR